MDATTEPKPFAWSYSKLKAYEDCPRRYYETQIAKNYTDSTFDQTWGNAVHAAIAQALRDGTDLPTKFHICQKWVNLVRQVEGELLVEDDCQWAITRDFKPAAWFAKDVWLRCIADAVKLNFKLKYPTAMVVDWKAGKSSNVDPVQLLLTSLMMLIQFPKLDRVMSLFVWLKEDHKTVQTVYRSEAADHWALLMPRIERLREATLKDHFPPQPGRFCRNWCPVKGCEFWGK
jgi:PD-(D/E)XK nuclease superfamily